MNIQKKCSTQIRIYVVSKNVKIALLVQKLTKEIILNTKSDLMQVVYVYVVSLCVKHFLLFTRKIHFALKELLILFSIQAFVFNLGFSTTDDKHFFETKSRNRFFSCDSREISLDHETSILQSGIKNLIVTNQTNFFNFTMHQDLNHSVFPKMFIKCF